MLTRLEISNFKTFEDFAVDFNPFAVVLGPNAAGKSNLFDALRLLSALASADVANATQAVRGQAHELFRNPEREIVFACEVLLDPTVTDSFEQVHNVSNTRLRYEVALKWRATNNAPRIVVARETVDRIQKATDPLKKTGTAKSAVEPRYASHKPYLATMPKAGRTYFVVSQDGRQGRLRESPAAAALATNLSTIRDATFLHLFALAEEFRSWRFLQFDPSVIRQPSKQTAAPDRLEPDGNNLARVLGRMLQTGADGTLKEIAQHLDELIGGINAITPRFLESTREWELTFDTRRDGPISARVVSDGTIRMTALLTAILDPEARGLICFEEPENGVHPQRLRKLMALLPSFATDLIDPHEQPPLRQMIVNSHSPVVLASVPETSVLFADRVLRVGGTQQQAFLTRLRPVRRDVISEDGAFEQYLESARNEHGV
jgi:predicted ATPase